MVISENSSEDEIANVDFYGDIAHALQNTKKENLHRLTNYTIAMEVLRIKS